MSDLPLELTARAILTILRHEAGELVTMPDGRTILHRFDDGQTFKIPEALMEFMIEKGLVVLNDDLKKKLN